MIPRTVFAHYIVGLALNQTLADWRHDIASASEAAIDGFALNIGAGDHFTGDALQGAYTAAAEHGNFSLFLSFDFGTVDGNLWTVDTVANLTNTFKDAPAQFRVDGKPLVSTFEGVQFADRWEEVRKKVDGDIFLVPDWSSLGPYGVAKFADDIDGRCQ